jgi:hypothetical protein
MNSLNAGSISFINNNHHSSQCIDLSIVKTFQFSSTFTISGYQKSWNTADNLNNTSAHSGVIQYSSQTFPIVFWSITICE